VIARWSRLVVDLNRGPDDPTLVMTLSDGRIVPGNRDLGPSGIAERVARYYLPYHAAIAGRLAAARQRGLVPVLISMHSFTPVWRGYARPGISSAVRPRHPAPERIDDPPRARSRHRRRGQRTYTGALEDDSLYRHGTMNGLPHVLIEVRQDLIGDEVGVARWADGSRRL
jgi:predicted N-formylglutamate amidohydrolase